MDRRTFLVGGGFAAAGVAAGPVSAQYVDNAWLKGPAKRPLAPGDIESAVQRLRKQFLAEFDPAYVENVIVPHFLVSVYDGERPYLLMIGVELTKENALPFERPATISTATSATRLASRAAHSRARPSR